MDDVYLEVIIIDRVPKSANGYLGLCPIQPIFQHYNVKDIFNNRKPTIIFAIKKFKGFI